MKGKKLIGEVVGITVVAFAMTVAGLSIHVNAETKQEADLYKLVWSDEFDGNSLDTSKWNYDTGYGGSIPGWGNNELQCYTDKDANVKVKDGSLVITAVSEKNAAGKTKKYTSGRINSSGKASFKYGKMEARIKLPAVKGLWPAFWMLGQNEPKGWPYCGELDIMETWNELQFAQGTVHWENELLREGVDTFSAFTTKMADKTQWHIYGINWDDEKIEFTLDNKVYGTFKMKGSDKSELNKEFYFLINCAVGGNLAFFEPDEDFVSADMMIDYVRVYQKASDNGTMTAKWSEKEKAKIPKRNITFKNGAKEILKQTVLDGENYVIPTVQKKGYKFLGWYRDKMKVKEGARAYSDMTIAAKWKKIRLKRAKVVVPKQRRKKYARIKISAKGEYEGFQVKIGKKTVIKKAKVKKIKTITFGKFQSGKTYKVKARAYSTDSRGKKVYGKWGTFKKITIK